MTEVMWERGKGRERDGTQHQQHSVFSGDREDIGAGDNPGARLLEVGLDGVDDLEPTHRVQVRRRQLLGVIPVQQDRAVAPLR